jgi:Uma2 family endonuclease
MVDQTIQPTTITKISADEFFVIAEATDERLELIEGEIIVMTSPNVIHQRLILLLADLVRRLMPNGEAFIAPLDVRLDMHNVFQPDLIWVAQDSKCTITEQRLEGAPDLVVEILSPGTLRRDKTVKFLLYEKHGVREYWMIDPTGAIEVWALQGKEFAYQGAFKAGESFVSPVLSGATVDVSAAFAG